MKNRLTKYLTCAAVGTVAAISATTAIAQSYPNPVGTPGKITFTRAGSYTSVPANCTLTIPSDAQDLTYDDTTGTKILKGSDVNHIYVGLRMEGIGKVVMSTQEPVKQVDGSDVATWEEDPTQVVITMDNKVESDTWGTTDWVFDPTNLASLASKTLPRKITADKTVKLTGVNFHLSDTFVDDEHVDTTASLTVTCYSD